MKRKSLLLLLLMAFFAPWAAMAQSTLTVHELQTQNTSSYVPFWGTWADNSLKCEMVYPATELGDMENGTITNLHFYTNGTANVPTTSGTDHWDGTFQIFMKEVSGTTITAFSGITDATIVYEGQIPLVNGEMTIEFTTPYNYNGGNLLLGVYYTTGGHYYTVYWEGENVTGASIYGRSGQSYNVQAGGFLPKTTFTYTPATPATTPPSVTTSDAVANLTNTSVTLGGTLTDLGDGSGASAGICYSTTATPTTSDGHVQSYYTTTGPITKDITGLLPGTTYYYRAYAYNTANSLADPTYGDIYSFTTAGSITLTQPANGEISVSVNGGTATTSSTYALEGQSVTLTATAADGYSLDCWNVTGVTGTASGDTYTFTMPANNVTATANIVPTSGGTGTTIDWNLWERATSISTSETYLIGAVSGSDVYLVLNYSPVQSGYYYASGSNYWGYTAKATLDDNDHVTGCTGNATDLKYAQWKFSAETGGIITSQYQTSRYLYGTTSSNWTDLYPATSQTTWTYSNDQLSYSSSSYYLYLNSSYYVQKGTSTTASTVYLYKPATVTSYAITATANPSEGGTIAGSDYYANGASCTLTATPAFGYDFVSWTEGNTVVSTDAEYTFTVSGARTLVANFESQGSCIKPTDLAQVPNTLAAHQAQLSWTENNEATEWEVVYSTNSEFDPDNETPIAVNGNPTVTIPDLNQETTYYARVRAICGQNSQSGWSEKATFVTISGHQAPTSVSHDPATLEAHKVTITWTGVATNVLHQSYDLYYSTSDETPSQSQTPQYTGITATSKEIDGLNAAKTYYVWVRDYCGDDGYSDWTGAAPFTTLCEPFTITASQKYRQEFESPVVNSVYNSTTGLELPVCWENPYTTGTNNAGKPHLVKAGASYNYASSGQVLLFYGSGSNYVTLPEFTNDLQDLQISFKWATESNSSGTLTLGYIKDGDVNYNTFTAIAGADYAACESSYHTLIQANPVELSVLPATAKRLAFRWVCSSQYSCDVDDLVVELIPSCKIPTGLTCTDYTATTATFDWTGNGENQPEWQLYISDQNIAPADDIALTEVISVTTKPYTVPSLTAEHTYYAWVRGNCTASSEGYSEWSEGIEFMPSAYKDFTYQEGATSSTSTIPFYGNYANNATNKGQMLIPASYFPTQMNDATVRRLTFYTSSSYATADWGDAEFDVLVAEVDETSFATTAFFDWNDMTTVYSGKLSVSDQQMVIELGDHSFTYNGGNLLIGFNLTTTGTSKTVYWVATYGSTYLGAYQYGTNSVSRSYYQPMITFNYLPNATPRPINPHATEELSTEVTLAWTAPNSTEVVGYQYQYKLATVTEWPTALTSTTDLTAPISGLTPEETYDFRVRAVYPGPAYSQYAETQFTTTAACPIPNGLEASNITMVSADLTWNASVEVANYTVEYRTAEQYDHFQGFENGFAGWTVINESTNSSGAAINVPEIRTDAAYHDTYGFRFSSWTSSSSGYDQYLISPELNYTGKIKFYYKNYSSWSEKFKVGYSSTDTDLSSFTWSDEVTVTNNAYAEDKFFEETLPAGTKYVAIYYCTGSSNAYLYIDDITIGNLNPAGAWTEATHEAPNTGAYTITLPNAGVKYDVRVYAECALNPETESTTTSFITLANGTKVFTNAGNDGLWSTGANWVPAGAPAITESAILRANATIESGTVATAKQIMMEGATTPTLTINDGGQLQTDNAVTATVKKHITSYTNYTGQGNGGYYLIGNPLNVTYTYPSSYGMITDNLGSSATPTTATYDLYNWYTSTSATYDEWRNYRTSSFYFNNGTGYLYANVDDVDLTFTGSVRANNTDQPMSLDYSTTTTGEFNGWNLKANPFVCNAYIKDATENIAAYYRMNAAGDGFEAATGAIHPMEGIFVQATKTGQSFKFTRTAPVSNPGQGNLNINLAQVVTTRNEQPATDNAIIRFGGSSTLEKFSFRENSSKIFIPMEGKDYAVVSAEQTGEIPVSFKAEKNGTYSLNFTSQEVSFSYLHLIDNLTGNDVDLLANPSYSFDAQTTDYAQRFRLVFATGSSVDGDSFGFVNGMGNLCIFGIEGEATIQVIDILGHVITSDTFSGSYERKLNVAPGVYMIRLINGNDVKVQKIVVR